jgi:hypothetical protein
MRSTFLSVLVLGSISSVCSAQLPTPLDVIEQLLSPGPSPIEALVAIARATAPDPREQAAAEAARKARDEIARGERPPVATPLRFQFLCSELCGSAPIKVSLLNKDSHETRTTECAPNGGGAFKDLLPGNYELSYRSIHIPINIGIQAVLSHIQRDPLVGPKTLIIVGMAAGAAMPYVAPPYQLAIVIAVGVFELANLPEPVKITFLDN